MRLSTAARPQGFADPDLDHAVDLLVDLAVGRTNRQLELTLVSTYQVPLFVSVYSYMF